MEAGSADPARMEAGSLDPAYFLMSAYVFGEFVFWSAIALVVYAYAGYPLALFLLSRLRQRPVLKGPVTRPVSFIITAHNEAGRIRAKIENTLSQHYPQSALDVIVASDCSTDDTDTIVQSFAPRVRLVRATERRGKEAAQQLAVEAATGEILIFSDVATALAPDAVQTMAANFADTSVGCVSSVDRFVDEQGRVSGEGAYVRYEMKLRALETAVNSLVGLSGSFFAARREVCRHWKADRQSDFNTLLNSISIGLRGVQDPLSVGYYRNIVNDRNEMGRKIRTVVRGLFVLRSNLRLLNPFRYGLFAWQLASHKLCRWLVPIAMIVALVANTVLALYSAWYFGLAVVHLGFYLLALVGIVSRVGHLRIPAFFVLANAGVLVAWLRFLRGDRIVSWTPSQRVNTLPQV
jgi:glycosyltransferase involved in cell wall biosynthesis